MTGQLELPFLHPTVPGKAPGIVNLDPFQIQCQDCGLIETQPDGTADHWGSGHARFLQASGSRFCTADLPPARRCHGCATAHARACHRCNH